MSEKMTFAEGQKLWFVPSDPRYADRSREVTVERIGRKWAVLDNGTRIDILTGYADGGAYTSPGCVWPSQDAWQESRRKAEVWRAINRATAYGGPPESLSLADLERIHRALSEGEA